MDKNKTAAIVLATDQRSRMKSDVPKVLHPIAGQPMISYVLQILDNLPLDRVVVVVGPGMEAVAPLVAPAEAVVDDDRPGTAHAVLAARGAFTDFRGDVLIVFGDMPLIRPATLGAALAARRKWPRPAMVVVGFRPPDPSRYSRLVMGDDILHAVVPFRDATPELREIALCSGGVMVADSAALFDLLAELVKKGSKHNLFDIVALARESSLACTLVEAESDEVLEVGTREQLARAEVEIQRRLRRAALDAGATLIDPDTVYLCHDTVIGRDSTIGPNVVFGRGVTVGAGATIKAFSHIVASEIADDAVVGPFALLDMNETSTETSPGPAAEAPPREAAARQGESWPTARRAALAAKA